MSATPKPIEWAKGRFDSEHGSVGGVRIFTVSRSTVNDNYLLGVDLPGVLPTRPIHGDAEVAKAEAGNLLAAFVDKLTA